MKEEQIDLRNVRSLVAQSIVDEIMGKLEKPFLTGDRFTNDMRFARKWLEKRIEEIRGSTRLKLFIDYLRSNGFDVLDHSRDDRRDLITVSRNLPIEGRQTGFAVMPDGLSGADEIGSLLEERPQFLVAYVTGKAAETDLKELRQKNVTILTNGDIVCFLLMVLLDSYFDEYFMTITTMPGLKEEIWSFLESFGIQYEVYKLVSEKWRLISK